MATQEALTHISVEASADLSASQFTFVDIDTNGQLVLASAAGDAIGVLQDKPAAAGRAGSVAISGRVKVVASAAITADDAVGIAASGQARTALVGDEVQGKAMTTVGAAGELVEVLLGAVSPTA